MVVVTFAADVFAGAALTLLTATAFVGFLLTTGFAGALPDCLAGALTLLVLATLIGFLATDFLETGAGLLVFFAVGFTDGLVIFTWGLAEAAFFVALPTGFEEGLLAVLFLLALVLALGATALRDAAALAGAVLRGLPMAATFLATALATALISDCFGLATGLAAALTGFLLGVRVGFGMAILKHRFGASSAAHWRSGFARNGHGAEPAIIPESHQYWQR